MKVVILQKGKNVSIVPEDHIDGFVQDCSISIANALEILQSCTKPSDNGLWHWIGNKPYSEPMVVYFTDKYMHHSTSLTHCGLVTPYGNKDLGQHWLR